MTNTLQTLAAEMSRAFETAARPTSGEEFRKLKDDAPGMDDAPYAARPTTTRDMLPDDWRYQFIEQAVDALAECEDARRARDRLEPDVYTSDLTGWLHSLNSRVYYLDEVTREYGPFEDGFQLLAAAQLPEKQEKFQQVLDALREELASRQSGRRSGGGIAMDAIETKTIEHDGQTYRIAIYPDADAPNPLEDWSEMGTHPEPEPPPRQLRSRPASRRRSRTTPTPCRSATSSTGCAYGRSPASCPPLPAARGIRSASPASGCPTPRRWHLPGTTAAAPAATSCGSVPARRATPIRSGATARSTATQVERVTACVLRRRAGRAGR